MINLEEHYFYKNCQVLYPYKKNIKIQIRLKENNYTNVEWLLNFINKKIEILKKLMDYHIESKLNFDKNISNELKKMHFNSVFVLVISTTLIQYISNKSFSTNP